MEYFTVSEPLIMVYVMKTVEEWSIQGSVESGWRLNRKRAQRRRLILARDRDMIVGAYRPVDGSWREEEHEPPGRWLFHVQRADDVWDDYVGKLVPHEILKTAPRSVVRYLPARD